MTLACTILFIAGALGTGYLMWPKEKPRDRAFARYLRDLNARL